MPLHILHFEKILPAPVESFSHIFYDCPETTGILVEFFHKFLKISVPPKTIYFAGNVSEFEKINLSFQIVMDVLRYNIWKFKLEKYMPISTCINSEVSRTFEQIFKMSAKIKTMITESDLFLGNAAVRQGE